MIINKITPVYWTAVLLFQYSDLYSKEAAEIVNKKFHENSNIPGKKIILFSADLEPVLSHTEKSCIALYYRQFSADVKIESIPVLLALTFGPNKTGLNLIIFHFNIHGKLSII